MEPQGTRMTIHYGIDEHPGLIRSLPLAFQHILAMFVANITLPLLLSGVLSLAPGETTLLIQCSLLMAGAATLLQVRRGGMIGSGLPLVMGTSNAFIATVLSIGSLYGIEGILGASLVGGLVEVFLGFHLVRLKRIFTPLVSGIVILTIGITLIPVGIRQMAGSGDSMGDPKNLMLAFTVLLVIVVLNQSKNRFLSTSSILLGILVGYGIASLLGMVTYTSVAEASWFSLPRPLQYRLQFHLPAIVAMVFMYIATAIETIGDISALTIAAEGRPPHEKELRGGVMADGLASALATLFNGFPNTSYTQNVGVVNLTGVFSRYIVRIGAVMLLLFSLLPKVGAVIALMPEPVLGGASIAMFSMVAVSGISLLRRVPFTQRNMLIIAVSVGLGVGLNLVPEITQRLPRDLHLFLTSGVVPASLIAIAMNLLIPEEV